MIYHALQLYNVSVSGMCKAVVFGSKHPLNEILHF